MQSYSLFKRTRRGTCYFYVQFRTTTGKYGSAQSVEALREKLGEPSFVHVSKRWEAEEIIEKAIDRGIVGLDPEKNIRLKDYLLDFWDFDKSEYIKLSNLRKPNSISRYHAKKMLNSVLTYIVNSEKRNNGFCLPDDLKVSQLRTEHLEAIEKSILIDRGLSAKTLLNVLGAVRVPVNELVRKGILTENPFDRLQKISVSQTETTVGTVTQEEAKRLSVFVAKSIVSGEIKKVYGFSILLAMATGMRQAEIRSLRPMDIEIPDIGRWAVIHVDRAFNNADGFKLPKGKKGRLAYCDKRLGSFIKDLALNGSESLIFSNKKNPEKPINGTSLENALYKALAAIGIDEEERQRRGLNFHSLRHYTNTVLNLKGGEDRANLIIGHSASAMNARYLHVGAEEIISLANEIGSLIPEEAIKIICAA